jgi:hypothetical protein
MEAHAGDVPTVRRHDVVFIAADDATLVLTIIGGRSCIIGGNNRGDTWPMLVVPSADNPVLRTVDDPANLDSMSTVHRYADSDVKPLRRNRTFTVRFQEIGGAPLLSRGGYGFRYSVYGILIHKPVPIILAPTWELREGLASCDFGAVPREDLVGKIEDLRKSKRELMIALLSEKYFFEGPSRVALDIDTFMQDDILFKDSTWACMRGDCRLFLDIVTR